MVSRDYTKEVGLQTSEKTVSKPLAAIVFVALAVAGWYLIRANPVSHHEGVPAPVTASAK